MTEMTRKEVYELGLVAAQAGVRSVDDLQKTLRVGMIAEHRMWAVTYYLMHAHWEMHNQNRRRVILEHLRLAKQAARLG